MQRTNQGLPDSRDDVSLEPALVGILGQVGREARQADVHNHSIGLAVLALVRAKKTSHKGYVGVPKIGSVGTEPRYLLVSISPVTASLKADGARFSLWEKLRVRY